MSELTKLPNIGPKLAENLEKIGIDSYEKLSEKGSVASVIEIGHSDMHVCCNMLYALEGAIRGVRWHNIPKEEREKVRQELVAVLHRR